MELILFALWFFLPAGLANGSPVFAKRIAGLRNFNAPLDFGKHYRGKRIFGANKTWRGLIGGTLIGGVAGLLQYYFLPPFMRDLGVLPALSLMDMVLVGALMGFGALFGDAIESFFKRQSNVAAGESWFPFDQLDYIIGGLIAAVPIIVLSLQQYLVIVLIWFSLHIVSTYIGFLLGLKEKPL